MTARLPALLVTVPFALTCGQPDPGPAQSDLTDCGDPCALTDANNYHYDSDLDVAVFSSKPFADIEISWPDLRTDLLGAPIKPSDVDQVTLVVFRDLQPTEVAHALATDTATQSEVDLFQLCTPTAATCRLSEFELFGSNIDVPQYFEEGTGTWLLALGGPDDSSALGLAMMVASNSSVETQVVIDDTTFSLTVEVDLSTPAAVGLPAGTAPTIDWSGLSVDGFGNSLSVRTLDTLEIARYGEPISVLEERFVEIERLAEARWSADVSGVNSFDLDDLVGDGPFPGIDDQSTWLLALRCSTCLNPAPRFVAHLRPSD